MLVTGPMAVPNAAHEESFVARLSPAEIAALRARAVARRFERGATLMHQDEIPGRVIVLERGHVKITMLADDGREIVLAFRGPGELLGEVAALAGEPRCATVRALDQVDALALTPADFDGLLEDYPRVALVILRVVIGRLRDADRQQFEHAAYHTLGRVARRLIDLAERFGEPADGGTRIALGISQEELAGWVGASREATIKALRDLRKLNLIETERRHITIRKIDELRRIA